MPFRTSRNADDGFKVVFLFFEKKERKWFCCRFIYRAATYLCRAKKNRLPKKNPTNSICPDFPRNYCSFFSVSSFGIVVAFNRNIKMRKWYMHSYVFSGTKIQKSMIEIQAKENASSNRNVFETKILIPLRLRPVFLSTSVTLFKRDRNTMKINTWIHLIL